MDKIKKEFIFVCFVIMAIVLLYEMDLLPDGGLANDGLAIYVLGSVSVLLTLLMMFLALRLFALKGIKAKITADKASYIRWCEIRLAMLAGTIIFDLAVYYATLQSLGALCALIGGVGMLFIVPTRRREAQETALNKDEQ